ncbi:MAG: hypothetical protein P8107_02940 [Spirochaetia bacterium]|jgi:hypothetical protein
MDDSFDCRIELSKSELIELFRLVKTALNTNDKVIPLFNKIEKKAYELLTIDEIEDVHKI